MYFEKVTMLPLIFYSIATVTFYNMYGISKFAD